jgi:hypothetical protein
MAVGAGARNRDVLELLRVLLLVQAAILVASTIEAFVFALAFGSAGGALLSAVAAIALLVARVRLGPSRTGPRRVIRAIQLVVLVTLAIDVALGLLIAHAPPPAVAVLTRFLLPVAILALLERCTAAVSVPDATASELAA